MAAPTPGDRRRRRARKPAEFYAANTKVQPAQACACMLLVDPVFVVDNAERATNAFEDMLDERSK